MKENKEFKMSSKLKILILILGNLILCLNAQEKPFSLQFHGQAIGWTNLNFNDGFTNQWGTRYIPELSAEYKMNENLTLDAEFSANGYGVLSLNDGNWNSEGNIKPYRMWMRLSSKQFELRAGLQKINFGSASILRPLMWFDRLDPRDPLQLTDGVYALLGRYYFLNNANIWLWGLIGNEEKRGWDMFPSDKKNPEYGGRFQFPAGPGELAITYHHRTIAAGTIMLFPPVSYPEFSQDRIAIDGKWDLGIGIWFENSLEKNELSIIPGQTWVDQLNLGTDYTFGIGNGLNIKFEHLLWMTSDELFKDSQNINYSALFVNYPLSLIDQVTGIVYYNWKDNNWYRIINLGRQYDNFSIFLLAYWNPEFFDIYRNSDNGNLFSGKGIQLMVSFNH